MSLFLKQEILWFIISFSRNEVIYLKLNKSSEKKIEHVFLAFLLIIYSTTKNKNP